MRQTEFLYKRLVDSRNAIFSESCLLCGSGVAGEQPLCTQCVRDMPWVVAPTKANCLVPPGYDSCWVPFDYAYPLDRLIPAAKLEGNLAAARVLAFLFAVAAERGGLIRPDFLIPVPLHWTRLIGRGFNQSGILASALGGQLKVHVLYNLAYREKYTRAQMTLSEAERKGNVIDAFRSKSLSKDQNISVVDDVVTTGATAGSLAHTLKAAGCGRLGLWALARA